MIKHFNLSPDLEEEAFSTDFIQAEIEAKVQEYGLEILLYDSFRLSFKHSTIVTFEMTDILSNKFVFRLIIDIFNNCWDTNKWTCTDLYSFIRIDTLDVLLKDIQKRNYDFKNI